MERDVLLDAGSLNPVFERHIDHRTCQPLEDLPFTTFSTEFKSLVTYRQDSLGGCLLSPDSDTWTFIGSDAEIVPCQILYIADTQPREAGEQGGSFQNINLARRFGEHYEFVLSEILFLNVFPFYLVEIVVDVLFQELIPVSYFQ